MEKRKRNTGERESERGGESKERRKVRWEEGGKSRENIKKEEK